MIADVILVALVVSSWTSAHGISVNGKVLFPVDETDSSVEDSASKSVSVLPTTVVKNYVSVNVHGVVPASSSVQYPSVQLVTSQKTGPAARSLSCQDGRCSQALDPFYNISDSDISTLSIPIVPIYKGVKRVNGVGNRGTGSTEKPEGNLIPNYDFRVVPIVKGLKGVQTTSQKPIYVTKNVPNFVRFPTRIPHTIVTYNGPKYPYVYQTHFVQNNRPHYYNNVSPGTANNHRTHSTKNGDRNHGWVNLTPDRRRAHERPNVQNHGITIIHCPVMTVHRNRGNTPSTTHVNVDGKLNFPREDAEKNQEIVDVKIDGKLGNMEYQHQI